MSILNKMLRDLEQRRPNPEVTATISIAKSGRVPKWVTLLLFVAFGALIWLSGFIINKPNASTQFLAPERAVIEPEPIIPVAVAAFTIEEPTETRAENATEQRAQAIQQRALAAAQAGQLHQALQLWQQLQLLTPKNATVCLEQARIWTQLGQAGQAERILYLALQQNIMHADVQLLLAQQAAAKAQWLQVNSLLPAQFELAQHPDYYGLKATAMQQLGQQAEALQWFSQLIVLQPQQARWWLGAAIAFDALAQLEQAQLHYRQALQWGDSLSVASRNYIQQRLAAIE